MRFQVCWLMRKQNDDRNNEAWFVFITHNYRRITISYFSTIYTNIYRYTLNYFSLKFSRYTLVFYVKGESIYVKGLLKPMKESLFLFTTFPLLTFFLSSSKITQLLHILFFPWFTDWSKLRKHVIYIHKSWRRRD